MKLLAQLPPETNIAVGNSVEAFERLAADATVIFSWSASGQLLRDVFAMCPKVRWVHSRSAGLDTVLFPELVESPVPLTNGRGVFSQSLGEFALGAILYFAKDFRRMMRNQEAGRWEQFDIVGDRRPDGGHRGLWRYRPRGGDPRARHGHAGSGGQTPRAIIVQRGPAGSTDLPAGRTYGNARSVRLRRGGGAADRRRRAA